jgi:ABC-type transport system involved in cytochrome c biogenesis permease subunit
MAYLHARYTLEWRGRRAAILAIVGFAALVFTYIGVDLLLPQIHGAQSS